MGRVRLSIIKGEPLRFLGHLDFLRTMERAIRRAKLPVAYSEGFNPHMKVSYDTALGVGVTAHPLYMDMELEQEMDIGTLQAALAAQLPPGVDLVTAQYIPPKAAKLMAIINYETYELVAPAADVTAEMLAAALAAFNARTEIPFVKVTPKKTRTIDMRPMIPYPVTGRVQDGMIYLQLGIYKTDAGSVKPGDCFQVLIEEHGLPAEKDTFLCARQEVYHRTETGALYTPLAAEVLG